MGMSLQDERMYLEMYCTLMDLYPTEREKAGDGLSEDFKRNMREVAYRTLRRAAEQIKHDLMVMQAREIQEANRLAQG